MIVQVNTSVTSYFPSLVRCGKSHMGSTEMLGNNQLTFRSACFRTRVDGYEKVRLDGLHSLAINHRADTVNSFNLMLGLMRLCMEGLFSFYSNYKNHRTTLKEIM